MGKLSNLDRSFLAAISIVLAVISFLAINIFANSTLRGVEADLTEERLFTLSDGTREILADLNEPIRVKMFVSRRLLELNPAHATYADRIRELLERYVDLSDGKVQLELYSPEPFTDEEDLAVSYGLQGIPLDNTGELGYFGLVATNSVDDLEKIVYLSPERESFLEYDLTKLIYKMANNKKPLIGLLTGLPLMGGPQGGQPWGVIEQIREFFDVTSLKPTDRQIDDSIDVLLIVHPKTVSEELQYAIDQFAMAGKPVVMFVDMNSEIDVAMSRGNPEAGRSSLENLLNGWGVDLVDSRVLGDIEAARRVNVNLRGQTAVADYVVWLSMLPKHMKSDDAITADLKRLTFASAGILKPIDGKGTTLTPLVTSSEKSMEIDVSKVRTSPDVIGIFRDFEPSGENKTIAARVEGRPSSAFPDGRPDPVGDIAPLPEAEHLAEASADARIVVVADSDMLHEQFWSESRQLFGQTFSVPFANNADFVVNTLENLAGGTALMSLRARTAALRPFTYVDNVRRDAESLFRDKEQELAAQIESVQQQLADVLNRNQAGGEIIVGPEDKARAEEYRREIVRLRKELRDVQFELRKDIEDLDALLKFFNIAAIPLLLGVVALVWLIVGRVRRSRRFRVREA